MRAFLPISTPGLRADTEQGYVLAMSSIFDSSEFNTRMFFPRSDTSPTPKGAEDLFFEVAKGVKLHVRWHHMENPRALVVAFHGNGEVVSDYDSFAQIYRNEVGAELAVVDFRGYGQSQGSPTYRNCIQDALPLFDVLLSQIRGRLPDDTKVIVLGRSLGGGCAAELAGQLPAIADGFVMESAASDPNRMLQRRGLSPIQLSPEETNLFDPRPKLARCEKPVLILHGAADTLILPDEARENFAALRTVQKSLSLITGRGHNDVMIDPAYWAALGGFVRMVVGS